MPTRTKKPSFSVVSGALTFLTVLAGGMLLTRPYIPLPPESLLAMEPGDYVKDGARERIRWLTLSEETLARARKADLPVLLVVAHPWSRFAHQLEQNVFSDGDVAGYLNRNFTCIRIDGLENPAFLRAYLPISRGSAGFIPQFQLWAMTPTGEVFDLIAKVRPGETLDPMTTIDLLTGIRNRFVKRSSRSENEDSGLATLVAQDRRQVLEPEVGGQLSFSGLLEAIRERIPERGGLMERGTQSLMPQVWRFQFLVDDPDLGKSLDPVLTRGLADLVRGGFFLSADSEDFGAINTAKSITLGAEMAQLLAERAALKGDEVSRWFARRTIEGILRDFSSNFGFFEGQRPSDTRGRSPYHSFPRAVLRQIFPTAMGIALDGEGDWALRALDIEAASNRYRVARLGSPAIQDLERTSKVLDLLMGSRPLPSASRVGQGYADTHGHITARLLQAARALGDQALLNKLIPSIQQLDIFVTPSGIRHRFSSGSGFEYSGDLLSVADAGLQDYLCFGSIPGLLVASQAMEWFQTRFMTEVGPLMVLETDPYAIALQANGVELSDSFFESGLARALRLSLWMARLVPKGAISPSQFDPQALANMVVSALSAQAGNAQRLGIRAAGLYVSALQVSDDAHAFAVGPNAVALANKLAARVPTRLISPAMGPVREDLQKRKPGIYVVRAGDVEGPLSVAQAAALLPPFYSSDRSL